VYNRLVTAARAATYTYICRAFKFWTGSHDRDPEYEMPISDNVVVAEQGPPGKPSADISLRVRPNMLALLRPRRRKDLVDLQF
jgi:hypothetical protein